LSPSLSVWPTTQTLVACRRNKFDRARASLVRHELEPSHRPAAGLDLRLAWLARRYHKRGDRRICQARRTDFLGSDALVPEENISECLNPRHLRKRTLIASGADTQGQGNSKQDDGDRAENDDDARGRHSECQIIICAGRIDRRRESLI
jgi:hypothetical protein